MKAAYTFKRYKVLKFNVFLIKKINTVFIENIAFLVFFLTKNKQVDFIVFFYFSKKGIFKGCFDFFLIENGNPKKFAAL